MALNVCGTNSTKRSSMVLAELVHQFDSSIKSTIVYVFIVLLADHRHALKNEIVQYIFL